MSRSDAGGTVPSTRESCRLKRFRNDDDYVERIGQKLLSTNNETILESVGFDVVV